MGHIFALMHIKYYQRCNILIFSWDFQSKLKIGVNWIEESTEQKDRRKYKTER